jgi:hypothetical protein
MTHIHPVTKDDFFYSIDSLFVEASGHIHRRATPSELQLLFHPRKSSEQTKDPVGHWYEAQLRHYGLPPSKNKAVAKTRLLDAVNTGKLAVPKDVQAIESQLAKEWAKKHREARAALKKSEGLASKITKTSLKEGNAASKEKNPTTKKRKAELDREDISQSNSKKAAIGGSSKATPKKETASQVTVKTADTKTKTTKTTTMKTIVVKTTATKSETAKTTPVKNMTTKPATIKPASTKPSTAKPASKKITNNKSIDSKATTTKIKSDKTADRNDNTTTSRAPKQMAKRGGASMSGKITDDFPHPGPILVEEARRTGAQTARRGKPQTARRGGSFAGPSRQEIDRMTLNQRDNLVFVKSEMENDASPSPSPQHGGVGLLNGRYTLSCPSLLEWEMYDDHEFTLLLALQGKAIWMSYDFGMFSGIMHLPERPYTASDNRLEFQWRGVENSEGEISYDNSPGWISFLGDGEIEGMIPVYGEARFSGVRVSGGETRSERSAGSMREEWDGYNENEYETRRVGRWS